jgi:lysozyme
VRASGGRSFLTRTKLAIALLLLGGLAAAAVELYERGWIRINHPSRGRYPVQGVDVSHHQGPVDWEAVRDAGIEFAFIKASEGADHRDRQFTRSWDRAGQAGLARGAYHFFTFCSPGGAQAENFVAAVGGSFGELPPAVDVEFAGNCRQWESVERIRGELGVFLARVEAEAGRPPIVYATAQAYNRILDGRFDAHPSWSRSLFGRPRVPPSGRWLFWQFADNGRVPGVATRVDLDVFAGSRTDFEALLDGSQALDREARTAGAVPVSEATSPMR